MVGNVSTPINKDVSYITPPLFARIVEMVEGDIILGDPDITPFVVFRFKLISDNSGRVISEYEMPIKLPMKYTGIIDLFIPFSNK